MKSLHRITGDLTAFELAVLEAVPYKEDYGSLDQVFSASGVKDYFNPKRDERHITKDTPIEDIEAALQKLAKRGLVQHRGTKRKGKYNDTTRWYTRLHEGETLPPWRHK